MNSPSIAALLEQEHGRVTGCSWSSRCRRRMSFCGEVTPGLSGYCPCRSRFAVGCSRQSVVEALRSGRFLAAAYLVEAVIAMNVFSPYPDLSCILNWDLCFGHALLDLPLLPMHLIHNPRTWQPAQCISQPNHTTYCQPNHAHIHARSISRSCSLQRLLGEVTEGVFGIDLGR